MLKKNITLLITVQLISLFGTHMSDFALGLYLYEKSHSLYLFSLISLFAIMPEVLLGPIMGHYVDTHNKKYIMLLGHFGAGMASMLILVLLHEGYGNIYGYLMLVTVSSFFNSLVFSSFNVLLGSEASKEEMKKLASFLQLGVSLVMILSPAVAASLLDSQGIEFVFYIDIATFSFALLVIALIGFSTNVTDTEKLNSIESIKKGFVFIKENELLWLSLVLFALIEFSMAQVTVLITPLILSISTKSALGMIMSISGVGMLIGSVIPLVVDIHKNVLARINSFAALQALIFLLAVFNVGVVEIAVGSFLFMVFGSLIGILNYTFWQENVEQKIKGKVFGFRRSVMLLSLMAGYMLSAPNVHLMQTLLDTFPLIYRVIGTHTQPGIRLLFIINAFIIVAVVFVIHMKQRKILEQV